MVLMSPNYGNHCAHFFTKSFADGKLLQVAHAFEKLTAVRDRGPLPFNYPTTQLRHRKGPENMIRPVRYRSSINNGDIRTGVQPALERHATLPITRFMFMLERMHAANGCAVWSLTVHCWLGPAEIGHGHSMFASWDPLDEHT